MFVNIKLYLLKLLQEWGKRGMENDGGEGIQV
jgi:hypothetical protein